MEKTTYPESKDKEARLDVENGNTEDDHEDRKVLDIERKHRYFLVQ